MSPRKKGQPKPKGPLTVQKMINALKMCPNKNAIVTVGDREGFSPERINKVCFIYGNEKKVDEVLLYGTWAWANYDDEDDDGEGAPFGAGCEDSVGDIAQAVACALADAEDAKAREDCMEMGPAIVYLPNPEPQDDAKK